MSVTRAGDAAVSAVPAAGELRRVDRSVSRRSRSRPSPGVWQSELRDPWRDIDAAAAGHRGGHHKLESRTKAGGLYRSERQLIILRAKVWKLERLGHEGYFMTAVGHRST